MNIEEKARDAVAYLQLPGGDSLAYNYLRGLPSTLRDEVLEEAAGMLNELGDKPEFEREQTTVWFLAGRVQSLKSQPVKA